MTTRGQQEEENWDDDFEFGSSAGSPVTGRPSDVTPPNLSPRAIGRRTLSNGSNGAGIHTPPNLKNRWSSGSFENWDDEDETINLKALTNGMLQQAATPKARNVLQNSTPTRTRKLSEDSEPCWDEEDDIDIGKRAGVIPTNPSAPLMSLPSTSKSINGTNGNKISAIESSHTSQQVPFAHNPPSAFPSASRKFDPSGSGTEISSTNTKMMGSSTSSIVQQSDTSASASTSTSQSSFFGRLGRRLSKGGSNSVSRSGTLSPSMIADMPTSPSPSTILSPPSTSSNLGPISPSPSHTLGSSPSKSKTGFSFGGGMLKRSGSASRSSNSGNLQTLAGTENGSRKAKPMAEGGVRTAPAVFNARRYTERIVDPSFSSSSVQHAPPAHGHSHSVAGMPRTLTPGWGAPPSPTRKTKQLNGLEGPEMLTSLSSHNKLQGSTSKTQSSDGSKPTHQVSASMSSAFFSSMRKRSNPLQVASKVPNSAMTGNPPISAEPPYNETSSLSSTTPQVDETPRLKDKSLPQLPSQAQIQTQRPRRSHRRNISTGAMITSVIDEVSSDSTINNKLSAAAMRERHAAPKSGLSQSTTASEIRRASTPPPRISTSSNGSSPPPVSPIEFTRGSEDSGSIGRRSVDRTFVLPPSMSIRSPALPTSGIRGDISVGRRSTDWSPSSSPGEQASPPNALLPPIELCPPSPPATQTIKPSSSAVKENKDLLMYTPDVDEDKTPMAAPRRRPHHLQIGTGPIVPAASLSNASQIDTPKYEISQEGLTPSVSITGSITSTGSNKTLAPNPPGINKHLDGLNGRTSPGISASLGRMAGASTAGMIDEELPGTTSSGLTRRKSLGGGVVSTTMSNSGSMSGGLKIPARISAKQESLKRDLGAVREFALSIDEIKRLQFSYELVLFEVRRLCTATSNPEDGNQAVSKQWYRMRKPSTNAQFHVPRRSVPEAETPSQPSSPVSPTFDKSIFKRRVHIIRAPEQPKEEPISESSFIPTEQKELATAALSELDLNYTIWWECAELLIELGGAAPPVIAGTAVPVRSPTMPALRKPGFGRSEDQSTPRARGRHTALPNNEPNSSITDLNNGPSPNPSISSRDRRGSTGQQDLNARQIHLLKGMLSTPDPNDLTLSVDFGSIRSPEPQTLSPVISNPNSTVRTTSSAAMENEGSVGNEPQLTEKEKKRNRRISLAGKLGVREILAALKWTKEKATQRYKQPTTIPGSEGRKSVDFAELARGSLDQSRPPAPLSDAGLLDDSCAEESRDNLNVASPAQAEASQSPYKRNRRRSLASIFKFGGTSGNQSENRSLSHSRSRIDLASPPPLPIGGGYPNSQYGGSRVDDNTGADADSDWDQLNSPSDRSGRYAGSQHAGSSAQDLSPPATRGRVAPVGIPITNSSRRGSSTVSHNASSSRVAYSSASASAASLVSSSVYGSAASQLSLHESFGGRRASDKSDDERRRLKKPPSKQPRRPPSASGRKTGPTSSQDSFSAQRTDPPPPSVASPMADRPYYSTRSTSHKSPSIPEYPAHPYPSASTRSAPLHGNPAPKTADLSQSRLALTPENIIPLLVYAREVKLKLADCLVELKSIESDLLLSKVGGEHFDNDVAVEFVPE